MYHFCYFFIANNEEGELDRFVSPSHSDDGFDMLSYLHQAKGSCGFHEPFCFVIFSLILMGDQSERRLIIDRTVLKPI